MPPKISVVMSVYNSSRFLKPAIDSVLAQTFTDFEFLVINDGSTDDSAQILASYTDPRIRAIDQPNQGLVVALNVGIQQAGSPLIARMDADDICLPDRLQLQYDYLSVHPDIALLGGFIETIDEDGRTLAPQLVYPLTHQQLWTQLGRKPMVICHPAVMYRRDAAIDVGLYDSAFTVAEDAEFFARLMSKYHAATLPKVVLRYRLVRSGMSSMKKEQGLRVAELVANLIDQTPSGTLLRPTDEQRRQVGARPTAPPRSTAPREIEAAYRLRIGRELLRGRQWSRAAVEYLVAAKNKPFDWHAYAGLACALLHHGRARPAPESLPANAPGGDT
jgi:glycosyltransferase involved in cell wall biosynthesis